MRLVLPLAILLALSLPAQAAHCETWSTTPAEIDAGGYYVELDTCPMCIFSVWIYEESNGIEGLQRGDEIVDDTCHGMIRADTIVF